MTVRSSCLMVPSDSVAVTTMALAPSRKVTGALTAIERGGVLSLCWCTWVPLRATVTLATPLLDVTSAATTLDSSLTRERSSG